VRAAFLPPLLTALSLFAVAPTGAAEEGRMSGQYALATLPAPGTPAVGASQPDRAMRIGVYDPAAHFSATAGIDIEHIFVFWQALDRKALRAKLQYAGAHQRELMVTVEPYTHAVNWRDGGEHLFDDIVQGRFDAEIDMICQEVGRASGHPLIRWGHEMEDPTGRYPWARGDAAGYIRSYRYVVQRCRKSAPAARFVWSPKGERNLADYYPGDAYVDKVGISLWGLDRGDRAFYGHSRGFSEALAEKYRRVAGFAKPIMIAELGIGGDLAYRDAWLRQIADVAATARSFPLLHDIVYFNDIEPCPWPMGLGSPDWRIQPGLWARTQQPNLAVATIE